MAHQTSFEVKVLQVKMPQELFRQLEVDAKIHKMAVSTWARFILSEAEMGTALTEEDYELIKRRKAGIKD